MNIGYHVHVYDTVRITGRSAKNYEIKNDFNKKNIKNCKTIKIKLIPIYSYLFLESVRSNI